MSKWSALKTSVATQNQQLRAKLLEQSSTLWERIRLKILDNPKRIEISGIKTANIALGVVTLKNSQAIRHLMLKVFKKQVECRQEWEKEIVRILCDEIDTLKAMKQFIPKNAYDHLCQHLTIQTFLEGDVLFKPGDVPRCSYIVMQGCVEERLERTLANQLLSEMKIHNHNDRKMSGSKVDAFNVLDSDANDFGWKEEGFDDYVNGLLGITVRSHCMNNSFGSRSRGENLHLRTSTAIAKKGAGKARLVDVLVMKFNAVDQVIPLQRQSAIDQYRISMKAEEKYNTLITFLRRECSLLKKIHPISLLEYIQCCDVREFTKGTFLCNEDKTAECVYILLSGSVRFQYQNQTNDCDDQGISPMMPNAPPKPPIFCLQQNKCLKDVIISDVKPGSMFGESFVLDKIEGRRTQMTLEKADLRHGSRRGKRKTNVNRYDQSGCRTSFLGADKFHKEGESTGARGESAEDLDKIYAKNIIRQGKRFKMTKGSSTGADEEEDIDTNLYENKRDWMSALKRREVDRAEVLMADKRWENRVSRDKFNRENSHFANHLVLSSLSSAYLMIPHTKPITPHHCLIVPTEPLKSMSQADVSVSEDVDRYKSALVRMFGNESPSRSVVFMETVVNLEKAHHTCIHAVPLDEELAQDAPLYFKQALQTSGSEWTSHKKVIDTSQKGLAKSVPPSFPYFHVELCSLDYSTCGMAHIIDDSSRFPASYGLDILCGLLGLPPQNFDKQMKVSMGFSDQRQMVMELASKFLKFDPAKTRE
eukprot:Stramenopile-MAST_4_protein_996